MATAPRAMPGVRRGWRSKWRGGDRLAPRLTHLRVEEGYIRATVTKPAKGGAATLRLEYRTVKQANDQADDVCAIDLGTSKLL